MNIDILPSNHILNAAREINSSIESDIMIRAIRVKNTSSSDSRIIGVQLEFRLEGKFAGQMEYPEDCLQEFSETPMRSERSYKGEISYVLLGSDDFLHKKDLAESPLLKPGEVMGILPEHFRIPGRKPVDECIATVVYTQFAPSFALEFEREETLSCSIPIRQYEKKSRDIFSKLPVSLSA